MKRAAWTWALAMVTGAGAASQLAAKEITLPPETYFLKETSDPGSALAHGYCAICHSEDYVRMQPPLSLKQWTAEVTKMKKTYGAVMIPDNAIDPIAAYLEHAYGPKAEPPAKP